MGVMVRMDGGGENVWLRWEWVMVVRIGSHGENMWPW